MFANKDQGGLNMPNIQYQDMSLKIAWVKSLVCQFESDWAKLALVHLPPGGDFHRKHITNGYFKKQTPPKKCILKRCLTGMGQTELY